MTPSKIACFPGMADRIHSEAKEFEISIPVGKHSAIRWAVRAQHAGFRGSVILDGLMW
jgi:hypothetical protein